MAIVLKKGGGVILSQGHNSSPTHKNINITVDGEFLQDELGNWVLNYEPFDPLSMVKKGFVAGDKVKVTVSAVKEVSKK